jgi:hypothetical protein
LPEDPAISLKLTAPHDVWCMAPWVRTEDEFISLSDSSLRLWLKNCQVASCVPRSDRPRLARRVSRARRQIDLFQLLVWLSGDKASCQLLRGNRKWLLRCAEAILVELTDEVHGARVIQEVNACPHRLA